MRAVIQRVSSASVRINKLVKSQINQGLLILIGIEVDDDKEDIDWLCPKIAKLRIFDDQEGVMNLSVTDVKGEILSISQFTLFAKTKKGNRPSYIQAAGSEKAIPLYTEFNEKLAVEIGQEIKTGEFGANMQVELINDGPVTIIIDTKSRE
jgi:D-aminoacyl-tRNA deacylase